MQKKSVIFILVFLLVFVFVFLLSHLYKGDIFFDLFGSGQEPSKKNVSLHMYDNKQININNVLVRAYYCVPDGRDGFIINDWKQVFSNAMEKISNFYEFQFHYNMKMDYEIYPLTLSSKYKAEHFSDLVSDDFSEELAKPHSESKTIEEIIKEIDKEFAQEKKWDLSERKIGSSYVVNLFILESEIPAVGTTTKVLGLNNEDNNSLVFSAIFTKDKFKNFYESVIAHEIGHSFGIPDFYSYSGNTIRSYGIMGSGFTRKLDANYLNCDLKEKMGLN